MAKRKKWVITTDGEHSLGDITKQLKKTGFHVENILDAIGCITGSANNDVADQLLLIPGVVDVSPEPPPIDIGPPGASVTW